MDPDANLKRQRELAQAIIVADEKGRASEVEDMAVELAELVQALDGWLTGGGFVPTDWQVYP